MSSGLADFDYPEFDNALLEAGAQQSKMGIVNLNYHTSSDLRT
jgi:hypothetical protein